MYDWNDLRVLLAVGRQGSTLGAARLLRTSQSTAARRIASLEAALGVTLFERRQEGYRLTEQGRGLFAEAARVEAAALALADAAAAMARGAAGTLRVTTIDIAASALILPGLPEFQAAHPAVHVDLIAGDEMLDIARGEADVGLRFGQRPGDPALVLRRLGRIGVGLYCSRDYAAAQGLPADAAALDRHALIRGIGHIDTRPQHRWLAEVAPRARIAHRSNSTLGILDAVRRGIGIGSLPCLMADADPTLLRVLPPMPEFAAEVWLVTAEATRRLPHVRAFVDFFAPRLRRQLAAAGA